MIDLKLTSEEISDVIQIGIDRQFDWKVKNWTNKLEKQFHVFVLEDMCHSQISRGYIFEKVKSFDSLNKKETNDYMRLFTQVMVWGFASSGYGPYRTNKFLSKNINHEFIKNGFDYCFVGEFEKSFKEFNKIEGLGISFISKLIYFAAKDSHPDTYPLIFDIQVVRSLLGTFSNDLLSLVEVMPKSNYKSYKLYRDIISENAIRYNIEADLIECILYDRQAHK